MTAKEYFKQIRLMDIKINNKIKDLEYLRKMARTVSGFDYSSEKVQASAKSGDMIGNNIARILDLEKEIERDIDEFSDLKEKINEELAELKEPTYIDVMYKRYFEYKHWDEIADEMKYSVRHIQRFHGSALVQFEKLSSNVAKCPEMSH